MTRPPILVRQGSTDKTSKGKGEEHSKVASGLKALEGRAGGGRKLQFRMNRGMREGAWEAVSAWQELSLKVLQEGRIQLDSFLY